MSAEPRVIVLGSPANEATVRLVAEWRSLGLDTLLVSGAAALTVPRLGDIVVGRLDVLPDLDGVEPGLLALLLLERRGLTTLNPARAVLDVHDKLRTARRLDAARVPHPRTVAVVRNAKSIELAPPLVLKPRFGSWGRDVLRCRDREEIEACLREVRDRPWFRRQGAVAQELIPPLRHDLRVVVAHGRVIGAPKRTAASGEWRTNVSLGGSAQPTEVDEEAAELARTAAAAVGMDLVGVDLLPRADGSHVVLELNGAVEFDAGYSLAGHDIYDEAAFALRLPVPGSSCSGDGERRSRSCRRRSRSSPSEPTDWSAPNPSTASPTPITRSPAAWPAAIPAGLCVKVTAAFGSTPARRHAASSRSGAGRERKPSTRIASASTRSSTSVASAASSSMGSVVVLAETTVRLSPAWPHASR